MKSNVKYFFGFFIIFLASTADPAWAIDLNAPAQKSITIQSELERGYEAISSTKADCLHIFDNCDHIEKVFEANKQSQKDTTAFLLGANFSAWIVMDRCLRVGQDAPDFPDISKVADQWAPIYFKNFRKFQKLINISDDKLISILSLNSDMVKSRIAHYDLILRAQKKD